MVIMMMSSYSKSMNDKRNKNVSVKDIIQAEELIRLYAHGLSNALIAHKMSISRLTVANWLSVFGLVSNPRGIAIESQNIKPKTKLPNSLSYNAAYVVGLYEHNHSISDIESLLGIERAHILSTLKLHQVRLRAEDKVSNPICYVWHQHSTNDDPESIFKNVRFMQRYIPNIAENCYDFKNFVRESNH